jgi:hypothetical protein
VLTDDSEVEVLFILGFVEFLTDSWLRNKSAFSRLCVISFLTVFERIYDRRHIQTINNASFKKILNGWAVTNGCSPYHTRQIPVHPKSLFANAGASAEVVCVQTEAQAMKEPDVISGQINNEDDWSIQNDGTNRAMSLLNGGLVQLDSVVRGLKR